MQYFRRWTTNAYGFRYWLGGSVSFCMREEGPSTKLISQVGEGSLDPGHHFDPKKSTTFVDNAECMCKLVIGMAQALQ